MSDTEPGPWTDPQTHLDTDPVNRPDAEGDAGTAEGDTPDDPPATAGDS